MGQDGQSIRAGSFYLLIMTHFEPSDSMGGDLVFFHEAGSDCESLAYRILSISTKAQALLSQTLCVFPLASMRALQIGLFDFLTRRVDLDGQDPDVRRTHCIYRGVLALASGLAARDECVNSWSRCASQSLSHRPNRDKCRFNIIETQQSESPELHRQSHRSHLETVEFFCIYL